MKLNNKGFAISTTLYMILIVAVTLITLTLTILSSRKLSLDKVKEEALKDIYNDYLCTYVSGTKGEIGSKYSCKVNDTDSYNFYILNKSNGLVNLIMEKNICSDGTSNYTESNNYCKVAFTTGNISDGPTVAYNYLKQATSTWTNITYDYDMYDDTIYSNFNLDGHARFITSDEITNARYLSSTYNYWTLNTSTSSVAYIVTTSGEVGESNITNLEGVRPVITIFSTQLEK